uniref:AAA domain-containing protein n=1 Tax=Clostridium sp. NkU-1 TaxID=1095009 RepID=UPI000AB98AAC
MLLTSYNNHPIDTVVKDLQSISYKGNGLIPFPIIRLGSDEKVYEALSYIKELYEQVKKWKVFENTLEKNRDDKANRMKQLTALLKRHEEILALREQKEAIECLMTANKHLTFQTDLQGRQLERVKEKLQKIGEVTEEQALALLEDDEEEFKKYLYFTSVKYLKRLGEPKNAGLWNILEIKDKADQVKAFNEYLGNPENVRKFLRIFPVVASTCISSHKIGHPEPYFDLVVMDEASQCNTALSLVPIIRGENLMLVGDPQQLNPVILLDKKDNDILKKTVYGSG